MRRQDGINLPRCILASLIMISDMGVSIPQQTRECLKMFAFFPFYDSFRREYSQTTKQFRKLATGNSQQVDRSDSPCFLHPRTSCDEAIYRLPPHVSSSSGIPSGCTIHFGLPFPMERVTKYLISHIVHSLPPA